MDHLDSSNKYISIQNLFEICLIDNHDDSDSEVNSTCYENDYDDLYDAHFNNYLLNLVNWILLIES